MRADYGARDRGEQLREQVVVRGEQGVECFIEQGGIEPSERIRLRSADVVWVWTRKLGVELGKWVIARREGVCLGVCVCPGQGLAGGVGCWSRMSLMVMG